MADGILRPVPSDSNPNDGRLYDPGVPQDLDTVAAATETAASATASLTITSVIAASTETATALAASLNLTSAITSGTETGAALLALLIVAGTVAAATETAAASAAALEEFETVQATTETGAALVASQSTPPISCVVTATTETSLAGAVLRGVGGYGARRPPDARVEYVGKWVKPRDYTRTPAPARAPAPKRTAPRKIAPKPSLIRAADARTKAAQVERAAAIAAHNTAARARVMALVHGMDQQLDAGARPAYSSDNPFAQTT